MRNCGYLFIIVFLILSATACSGKSGSGGSVGGGGNKVVQGTKGCIVDSSNVSVGCLNQYLNNRVYIDSPNGYTYGIELDTNLFAPMATTWGSSKDFSSNSFYKFSSAKDFWGGHTGIDAPEQYLFVMSYGDIKDQGFCKKKNAPILNDIPLTNRYDASKSKNTGKSYYFVGLTDEAITYSDQNELVPCTFSEVGLPDDIQFPLFLIVDDEGIAEEISETNHPEAI